MGKSRAVRREASGLFVTVFSANTTLGYQPVRQVPIEYAIEQVALKKWREVTYQDGDSVELLGLIPLKPAEKKTLNQVLIERLIAVTITNPELRRNAGLYGKSHTIGMPEWRRLKRHARFDESKILAPEDAIERAIEKVRQWPFPQSVLRDEHGNAVMDEKGQPVLGIRACDKAVRVYPHPPKDKPTKGALREPASAPQASRRKA